jgi:hypothetical protein
VLVLQVHCWWMQQQHPALPLQLPCQQSELQMHQVVNSRVDRFNKPNKAKDNHRQRQPHNSSSSGTNRNQAMDRLKALDLQFDRQQSFVCL